MRPRDDAYGKSDVKSTRRFYAAVSALLGLGVCEGDSDLNGLHLRSPVDERLTSPTPHPQENGKNHTDIDSRCEAL